MASALAPTLGVTFVVVTGGPCAGKTEFMKRVIAWLAEYELRVAVIPEAATHLITQEGRSPSDHDFQDAVLAYYLREEEAYRSGIYAGQFDVVIMDRGPLDARAYVGNSAFSDVASRAGFSVGELRTRYAVVVHLVTAADGAEEFYNLSNEARTESPTQARDLDKRTRDAWHGHRHHIVVGNETDFQTKMRRALEALGRVLPMSIPIERERKFIPVNFTPALLNTVGEVTVIPTVQVYLPEDGEGFIPRIRVQVRDTVPSYILERKRETEIVGERHEDPRVLTRAEYRSFLRARDRSRKPISKFRHVFFLPDGHRAELDEYRGGLAGLWTLEVEVKRMDEQIALPPWNLFEVTRDPRFGNHELARHGVPT